ncbi:MAG: hypothetical protein HBSAPP04_06540 [Ignavibacteriaceae bacterium]|nr:MAG: hypothetical protein HBSAPP04_06540 [Ignavibacteriaceae bacterium]
MKVTGIILTAFLIFTTLAHSQIGGYALNFDGVDDYAYATAAVPYDDRTIEVWIKSSASVYQVFIGLTNFLPGNSPSVFMPGIAMLADGKIEARLRQGGVVTTSSSYNDGKWHHVVLTSEGLFSMSLYVDGGLIGTSSMTNNQSWWTYTTIGSGYSDQAYGAPSSDWHYSLGSVDEVRLWTYKRTQQEIIAGMYRELTGYEAYLAAYFKMNDGVGSVLTDSKNSGTNGTVSGALWKASGAFAGPGRTLNFTGGQYARVLAPDDLASALGNQSKITIAGWVNPASLGKWQTVFSRWTPLNYSKRIVLSSGAEGYGGIDDIYISFTNGAINGAYTQSDVLQTGKWVHLALVFDGDLTGNAERLKLYVNGRQETLTFWGGAIPSSSYPAGSGDYAWLGGSHAWLFNDDTSASWNGSIDELSIWTTALTNVQVTDMMCRSLARNESGLQAYYRFDEKIGTTAYDNSSNNRHGTLDYMSFDASTTVSTAFNTWIGGVNSSASNGTNWSLGTAPNNQSAGIYKWPGGSSLTVDYSPQFLNLFIAAGSDPAMTSYFNVAGNLFVDDDLDLAGQNIYLQQKGYLFERTGRIFGAAGSIWGYYYTIPSTSVFTDFQNTGFSISSPSALMDIEIRRYHNVKSNDWGTSISRNYWVSQAAKKDSSPQMDPSGGGNPGVKFTYNDQELNGIPENNLLLAFSSDNGTTWTTYPGTVNTTENTVTVNEVPSVIGLWTLTNSSSPLPVELANFTSSVRGKTVTLNWETKTEVMNHGFEVERKITGSDWQKTGFVEGHGTSNSPKYYTFTDQPNASGKILYRLKQIDTDGGFEYSPEISVEIGLPQEFALHQNYPNPFNPETVIGYALPVAGAVTLEVYNSIGEKVATLVDGVMQAGNHELNFRAENLPSGLYFYKINVTGVKKFTSVKKFVLIK